MRESKIPRRTRLGVWADPKGARSRDRLTDNQGRTVGFRNAILIMTSNIGASLIADTSKSITAQNEERIYQ